MNEEHRIDAEYFGKNILNSLKQLSVYGTSKVGDIADVTDGIHSSIDYDENSNINLISATSPKENVFDLSRGAFISEKAHKMNPRTALRKNDVIISTVGTIGNCAVVDESILPANSDRHVGIIRIKNEYSSYVLSTFFLSKFGRIQTMREATGNVQLNLFIYKLRELQIPLFPLSFQSKIERQVKVAHAKLAASKSFYKEAENYLIDELGIRDWQPQKKSISVKSFSEFSKAGRLDAEYYQPKYDEIEELIKSYKGGYDLIKNLFNQNLDTCNFSKQEYNYIEIGDVNVGDGSVDSNIVPVKELPDNAKRVLHYNDIIISKVRPYRGAVAIINIDDKDLIGSGAFTVLHEKTTYKKEVLQVLLRTKVYKDWLLKWNVGTSYPVIKDEDILNLPIPLIPDKIQTIIAEKIQESLDLRKESKDLLEQAKRMVENEIEKVDIS